MTLVGADGHLFIFCFRTFYIISQFEASKFRSLRDAKLCSSKFPDSATTISPAFKNWPIRCQRQDWVRRPGVLKWYLFIISGCQRWQKTSSLVQNWGHGRRCWSGSFSSSSTMRGPMFRIFSELCRDSSISKRTREMDIRGTKNSFIMKMKMKTA